MISKLPPKKRTIVHLGNVGYDSAKKSREYAKRFPNFEFVGVDKYPIKLYSKNKMNIPKNLNQIESEFLSGLHKLEDSSVNLISSEFAVGHYELSNSDVSNRNTGGRILTDRTRYDLIFTKKEYTKKIIKLCYKKLIPGGKIIFLVFTHPKEKENALKNIQFGINAVPFKKAEIQEVPAEKIKNISTHWAKDLGMRSFKNNEPYAFYRVTLVK